jgi:hypothetical protein
MPRKALQERWWSSLYTQKRMAETAMDTAGRLKAATKRSLLAERIIKNASIISKCDHRAKCYRVRRYFTTQSYS